MIVRLTIKVQNHHPYLLLIFCFIIARLLMVTSSSSKVLIASLTKSLSCPLPLRKLVLQMSVWKEALSTLAFQFLSITLVRSISLVFYGSSLSHLMRSTVISPQSSSANSCSILGSLTNSFFMNDLSSMSHLICSAVGASCLMGLIAGFIIIFSDRKDGFAQILLVGFGNCEKKLTAMLLFYFSIAFFYCYLIYAIF